MWSIFGIFLLLLSVALFVLRHAFPIPWFARHCYWWGGGFLFLFLAIQLWFWLAPRPTPYTANEAEAVRAAVVETIEKAEKAGVARPATVAVVHLVSDPTDEATAILRRELAAREGWTAVSGSPAVAFLKGLAKSLYEATSVDEYLLPGRRVGIDVLFYGTVRGVATIDGMSRAVVSLTVYDTRTGKEVLSEEVAGTYPRVHTAVGRAVVATSRTSRGWIFGAIVVLLPWIASPLLLRVLTRRTNGASAGALAGLVALDAVAGLVLFYGIGGRIGIAALVLLACVVYDLVCCEILSRRAA